jgi:hypothetical protein
MTEMTVGTTGTIPSGGERRGNRRTIQVMQFSGATNISIEMRPFPMGAPKEDLPNLNQGFVDILEELRLEVQQGGVDLTASENDYLTPLRDAGRAAYNAVFTKAAREYIAELEEKERARGLSFTFRVPPEYRLFWEMLYSGTPFSVEPDQFWGFRYPLGRAYWGENEIPDLIRIGMGIFSAIHDTLQCSRDEVVQMAEQLKRLTERSGLALKLRMLDEEVPLDALDVQHLIELFHSEEFMYGVVHFACHCEVPEAVGATQAYLSLTAKKKELDLRLESLLTWQDFGFQHGPFVFLNACASETPLQLVQSLSFPAQILNFGAGGVIATACTIPDNFASAFAAEFYRRLFHLNEEGQADQGGAAPDEPNNVGEVLLRTRRHFLQRFNNPLGLAYGLYAVSNQKIQLMG